MSGNVIGTAPCPGCRAEGHDRTGDNLNIYDNGTAHCFARGHDYQQYDPSLIVADDPEDDLDTTDIEQIQQLPFAALDARGISLKAAEAFGIRTEYDGSVNAIAYYFPMYREGRLTGYQRKAARAPGQRQEGDTWSVGETKGTDPFGSHITGGQGQFLLVFEGGEDVAAAYDLMEQTGKAYRSVATLGVERWKKNLEWYSGWQKVLICFDPDEAGQTHADEFAAALPPGVAHIMQLDEAIGDPNAYLVNGKAKEFRDCINRARKFKPDGIINGAQTWELYKTKREQSYIPWPAEWEKLSKKTYGLRAGEISMITSGTGMGKSSFLRELLLHIAKTQRDPASLGYKIGVIALEEGVGDTVQGLLELVLEKRISLPDVKAAVPEEDVQRAWRKLFSSGRFEFADHQATGIGDGSVIAKIRHMVHGLGCTFIMLDHITIAVSEMADGNTGQDAFMNELLKVVKGAPVHIAVVSHLRKTTSGSKSFEEGAIPTDDDLKGSGSLKQISFDILALSRNKMAEDEQVRNLAHVHVLKSRKTGRTGRADSFLYNDDTGRLLPFVGDVPDGE